jgi:WD40 repeat protein
VNSLDLNPFQANLLASGASDSEVSIWDLNKFSTPMTPGAKAQPLEDVRCVAWNKQVQHILATTGKYFFSYLLLTISKMIFAVKWPISQVLEGRRE